MPTVNLIVFSETGKVIHKKNSEEEDMDELKEQKVSGVGKQIEGRCSSLMQHVESQTPKTLRGAQWLSGQVFDSRLRGCGFEPHRHCHYTVSLSKTH